MPKKIGIVLLAVFFILAAAVFFFRYQIMQYSAEKIIRSSLPDYIKIDTIKFDFRTGKVTLRNFRISNPPDFSYADLLKIEEVTCRYKLKGKNIIDGLEVLEPIFQKSCLIIERLGNGRLNLTDMQAVIEKPPRNAPPADLPPAGEAKKAATAAVIGDRKISDIIKLPQFFSLKDGKIIFVDGLGFSRPYTITFENVFAGLSVKLDDHYSKVLDVASAGEGNINGDRSESVKWEISYNPTTPRLTMSNRFLVSGLDIITFEPYYDAYSPLVFKKGKFSGTLIFDFDNGSIGSSNEIHLSDFRFYVKQGYENASFWETTVPDLVKYFSTPSGEIVFDFKIKGEMTGPKFYLGPISKQAITAMAVDKIQDVIQSVSKSQGGSSSGGDMDKAKQYIDLFKNLMKK